MKKLILAVMLSVLLASFGAAMAATSQIDNVPGGAGISIWQAGSGFQTLVNIQNVNTGAAYCLHIAIYDMNSNHLLDWNAPLTPLDNYGVVVSTGSAAGSVYLNDYSDMATPFAGCGNPIPDIAVAGITLNAPANAAGVSAGYLTVAITAIDNSAPYNDPIGQTGNLSDQRVILPDSLFIRTAVLTGSEAFAMNAPMLQGFFNFGATLNENDANEWSNTLGTTNTTTTCDFNLSGDALNVYTSIDDLSGVNIDFPELFAHAYNNGALAQPVGIVCDPAIANVTTARTVYPVLGSANGIYWGRFNENPATGTNTSLLLVAPNSTRVDGAADAYPRELSALLFNDAEIPVSFGPLPQPEVAFIDFGTAAGQINVGGAIAGEARLVYLPPAFGLTFTASASFADAYPLVRTNVNIVPQNITYPGLIPGRDNSLGANCPTPTTLGQFQSCSDVKTIP